MRFHQAVARALKDNGVDTIFGLVGDANLFTMHSFVSDCGGRFVGASNEIGSALMALGYATLSNKVGVCSVTHGPAMTNTVTALVEGVKGSVPMVLLCGDTPVIDRENNQNVAQRDVIIATGAGFEQLRSPRHTAEDVARALRRALLERRPIALNLPYEYDWADVDYEPVRVQVSVDRAIVPASDDLDNAIGIIAAAKRPLIMVGRGAVSPLAKEAIAKLAKRIEAPICTTLKAKDSFMEEDFNVGICGTVSTPVAVEIIMESDCLIAFGASLTYRTTSHGAFVKGKRVIQINQEPAEIGKNVVPDVGVVGDPAGTADLIAHWLDEAEIPPSGRYTEELRAKIANEELNLGPQVDYDDGTVNFAQTLVALDRMLPEDRVLVSDGGRFLLQTWPLVRAAGGGAYVWPVNFGSIGLGLAHAIGASCAADGRPTVLITGDGGFMNGGLAEFNTAVRYKLDLIIIVCNDGAYGAELAKFKMKIAEGEVAPGLITFEWPEFADVAKSLGGAGYAVRSHRDLEQVEIALKQRSGPVLIDLKVNPYTMPMSLA